MAIPTHMRLHICGKSLVATEFAQSFDSNQRLGAAPILSDSGSTMTVRLILKTRRKST